MSAELKPALTAEEWTAKQVVREDCNGNTIVIERSEKRDHEAGGLNHALAAIALANKPFGFTHSDVELLRKVAAVSMSGMLSATVSSVADRIEAILPPAEVTA